VQEPRFTHFLPEPQRPCGWAGCAARVEARAAGWVF
jgi:hypothetical protein